jgi:hypothetical protein
VGCGGGGGIGASMWHGLINYMDFAAGLYHVEIVSHVGIFDPGVGGGGGIWLF